MHLEGCMRCGVDVDDLYYSKDPAWCDWFLCEFCVREVDAEFEAKTKDVNQSPKQG